jgi:cell division protein FtsB
MTQEEKAAKYDSLVREGDAVQREISKLQSQNAGVSTTSTEYDAKMNTLRGKLLFLEGELNKLFMV